MTRSNRATQRLAVLSIAIATAGCAAKVVSLDGAMPSPARPSSPFPVSVRVQPFTGPASEEAASLGFGADALAQVLRDQRIFARVNYQNTDGARADLILRGEIQSRWDARGAANFFTWWPGGLVLAPNWYGTRMQFFAQAKLELVDANTAERVGEYVASTSHEVVHRSATPGPFFGALIIVPGVVKGATLTSPRARYKAMVHPVAYKELWQRVAGKIVEERGPFYLAEAEARQERCGDRLDLPPEIGQAWAAFHSCQSDYYETQSKTLTDQGSTSVFLNTKDGSRIYVIDDAITQWEQGAVKPATGMAPTSPSPKSSGAAVGRLNPPSQSAGLVVSHAVEDVRRAAEDALAVAGFEIRTREEFYVDGVRPRRVGVFVGSGGERAGIWFDFIEGNRTRVRVRTQRTFVGGAGQRNWDADLLSEIQKSLARPK